MTAMLMDWSGKVRVRHLVQDSLTLMVRRPAVTLFAPFVTLWVAGAARQEADVLGHFALLFGFAASWVWMSYLDEDPPKRPLLRLILIAGSVASFGCSTRLVQLVNPSEFSPYLLDAAILLTLVAFPLVIPAWASGDEGPVRALQRSRVSCRGHGIRIAASWMLLMVGYAAVLFMLAFAAAVLGTTFPQAVYAIELHVLVHGPLLLTLVLAGISTVPVAVTMALCTAAHTRLRRAQVTVRPERWVEVFR